MKAGKNIHSFNIFLYIPITKKVATNERIVM